MGAFISGITLSQAVPLGARRVDLMERTKHPNRLQKRVWCGKGVDLYHWGGATACLPPRRGVLQNP